MNLLVTGGAGFIGSQVLRHLLSQSTIARLVNLDCLTYAGHPANVAGLERDARYRFEPVDLRHKGEVLRVVTEHHITHVLHLAAESHVDRSIAGPGDFIHTNVIGTFHLLEACRACWSGQTGRRRFHQVSTDEVYGSLGPEGAFHEASPYAPNSPYSASKAAGDLLVRAYRQTYGLPVVVTNCSNNYGPRQYPEKLIPVAIQCALQNRPIPIYGNGRQVRDWLHVEDHAEALWRVLTDGRDGETYNIGGGNERANLPLVEQICDWVDELAARAPGTSRQLITFVPDRPGHDQRYAIDGSKIERELGWKPTRPFDTGLRETVRWYLENQAWVETVLAGHPPRTA